VAIVSILHSHAFHGAITGFLTAAAIDFHAFRSFKSWNDAAKYDWSLASFRWFQGVTYGIAAAYGLGQLFPDIATFGV
jgi:hypothetical protein